MDTYHEAGPVDYDGEEESYMDDEEFEEMVKSRRVVLTEVLPDGRMVYSYTGDNPLDLQAVNNGPHTQHGSALPTGIIPSITRQGS